jgi:predicted CXXCH cytochrome family protein
LPPLSESPYLNTSPDAKYLGSARCAACHPDRHESFRHSGMGRSMADIDLRREPADGAFDHEKSKRRYQVVRRDGQMWHRELLLGSAEKEVVLAEHPVRYVVGSGRHSLTYLVEVDGFMVESPITWYTSRKAWGVSPGYDMPNNPGFERPVLEACVRCHAGKARTVGEALHRIEVHEAAIGCERCHGPGSLHAQRHKGHRPGAPIVSSGETDFTIVNPSRLSPDLSEAICSQCHLESGNSVLVRGREMSDFRPGLPLRDFRQDFVLRADGAPMTVVGHVEQMHLSRCYKESGKLTCLSCHDPHGEPDEKQRVKYYRAACLGCHEASACKLPARKRREKSPQDSCVQCHMPTSPTEIPHLAFTHHRVGVHSKGGTPPKPKRGTLRPLLGFPPQMGEVDRKRSLGLGYLELSYTEEHPDLLEAYLDQGIDLLQDVRSAGLRDSAIEAGLARAWLALQQGGVSALAENALQAPNIEAKDRCTALWVLANAQANKGHFRDALATAKKLTLLRRNTIDWQFMARCHENLGQRDEQMRFLTTAVRINPRLWQFHRVLADYHKERGDEARAAFHRERAVP